MNETDRKALRDNHKKLVDDLELTPDVSSYLYNCGDLTDDMIENIQACKTRQERIQKLLMLLPRRGPQAFNNFVCAIQDQYSWLAKHLCQSQHKNAESERLSWNKTVDIFVHETFGNSKRISETDKRKIRDFLHNLGKNKNLEDKAILLRIYSILDNSDSVDGHAEVTIDMIERKVKEMNKNVDMLQNEINNCYTVLQVEKSERPLHEVLENILKTNDSKLAKLEKQLEACEKERDEWVAKIENIGWDLLDRKKTVKQLADSEHENERYEAQIKDLKHKCERLEQYSEVQQTTASQRRFGPMRASCPEPFYTNKGTELPEGYKDINRNTSRFPPLGPQHRNRKIPKHRKRKERPFNAENQEEKAMTTHHDFPRTRSSSSENSYIWR